MLIHLPSLPAIICTSQDTAHRVQNTVDELHAIGHTKILILTARRTTPYYAGLCASVKTALQHAPPFLIFEDDITPHPAHFRPVIDIPDETDVVNLGPALAGYDNGKPRPGTQSKIWRTTGPLYYDRIDSQWIRPHNMLYAHALLFVTPWGCIQYRKFQRPQLPRDTCDTEAQATTYTIAPTKTFFYQREGRHVEITRLGLEGL